MASKSMKRNSTSFLIGETQIKIAGRYYILIGMTETERLTLPGVKDVPGLGFSHCQSKWKMVQPFWK
jgi:hypothetical protein